jgi:hypothetical protein
MSKHLLAAAIAVAASLSLSSSDKVYAELPETIQAGDAKLVLNGSGVRTKYLMQMYVAGLYLARPSDRPAEIVSADAPMAIRLEITSGLVTQEKLIETLNEGFANATNGKPEPIRKEIDHFRKCLAANIVKGDVLDLVYVPTQGVTVVKNGKKLGVVEGLAFKKALFGIWLSDSPADEDLKQGLLMAKANRSDTARK